MTLKPRVADTGAIRRWGRQAAELVGRQFTIWLLLSGLMCITAAPLGSVGLAPILMAVLSAFALHANLQFAAISNDRRVSLSELPGIVWHAWRGAYKFCNNEFFFLVLLFLISIPTLFTVMTEGAEISPTLSAMDLLFYSSGLVIALTPVFYPFAAVYRTVLSLEFGADAVVSRNLALQGFLLNVKPLTLVSVIWIFVALAVTVALPVLLPVLWSIGGAVVYVSFRDIFLHDNENGKVAVSAVAKAPSGAAAA